MRRYFLGILLLLSCALWGQPSTYQEAVGPKGTWKWHHAVSVECAPQLCTACISLLRELNALPALQKAGIEFYLVPARGQIQIWYQDVPGPPVGTSILSVGPQYGGSIIHGRIWVEPHPEDPAEPGATLVHEMMHILGFQGHLLGSPSSLDPNNINSHLTPIDKELIALHY